MCNASILLATLAGSARQSESRSALAIAAWKAALRMYSVLSARETRTGEPPAATMDSTTTTSDDNGDES
jgi:hypothetical protein